MPAPSTNAELFEAFARALKADGATDPEAAAATTLLQAKMQEHSIRNPRRLGDSLGVLGLAHGDLLVLRELLEVAPVAVPAPAAPASSVPPVINVSLDKAPSELRDGDLIQLFARDKSQDVVTAVRRRFGDRAFLVMDGPRVDVAATLLRLEDGDDGDVFDGKVVATVTEALDREYMADPMEGPSTKLVRRKLDGRDTWRAPDGVHWPEQEEARLFVIWSRRAGHSWAASGQPAQQRYAVAEAVAFFPDRLPPYMQDARVRFLAAKGKKDPSYSAADAEVRYQPQRRQESVRPEPRTRTAPEPTHFGEARRRLGEVGACGRRELRSALDALTDADFSRMALDYFPNVYSRYSRGMEKTERANLLFQLVADAEVERAIRNLAGEQRG